MWAAVLILDKKKVKNFSIFSFPSTKIYKIELITFSAWNTEEPIKCLIRIFPKIPPTRLALMGKILDKKLLVYLKLLI